MRDDIAFEQAAREAHPRLVRYATTMVGPDRAEEAAQEALVKAWRYLDSYDGRGSFEGWLIRICRRCALDVIARDARQPAVPVAVVEPPRPDGAATLHALIRDLPSGERDAFGLTQVAGLSYAEAAGALGVPIGTIRSRVARARRFLIEALRAADAS